MKTVAIISNTSWSLYNFRKPLIESIQKNGFKVCCIAPYDEFSARLQSELNCEYIELKKLNAKGANLIQDLQLAIEFFSIFKKKSFDVIYSYTAKPNIYGNLGSFFHKNKIVNTVNGLGTGLATESFISKIMRLIYKIAFVKSNKVIFQNRDDENYFLEHNIVSKNKTIVVNGSGVNTNEFLQIKHFTRTGDCLRFLLSARLVKEKGIIEYIEASKLIKKKYPNVEMWMCGIEADNPSAISLSDLAILNKENTIQYLGAQHDMKRLLDTVDVLVLPSYYREGVPRILLEGLSKGLPLITTNGVGCKETIEDGKNGYQIEMKSIESLTAAIEKMILLPTEKRIEMAQNSREMAEKKFDVNIINQTYIDLLYS